MSDLHIDDFYRDIARALVLLYGQFPRQMILYTEDICGEDQVDEFGLSSTRFNCGFSALLWLADCGYIKYLTTIRNQALDQVVLTHKGFTRLFSRMISDNDEATPLSYIELIRLALKSDSSIAIEQAARAFLTD